MIAISESEMNFGDFDEANIFHIEKSRIYKELGTGIKTVEFILKYKKDTILFLEAKKTCPNESNKNESTDKTAKFEEYYTALTEKFVSSLHLYIAAMVGRFQDISEVGSELMPANGLQDMELKFCLVIKNAKIEWLAGPMAELNARLFKIRKIWRVQIVVLNEELAKERKLIAQS